MITGIIGVEPDSCIIMLENFLHSFIVFSQVVLNKQVIDDLSIERGKEK